MGRNFTSSLFRFGCAVLTFFCVLFLFLLLYDIGKSGIGSLNLQFLNSYPSRFPEAAGIKSALWGTLWFISLTSLISIPLGIASSIYLEEFAPKGKWIEFIEINIANLAGVPSIVFGILGLAIFVRFFGLGRSVLSGALTMTLLILPTIIVSSREAIRAVPNSLRQASFALGASRWQTTRDQVLPVAFPGIMTGVILAISRAMGETAPLIMMGALTYVAFVPTSPLDGFTALPIQIFNWISRPQAGFHNLAAAGIIVLLIVLLMMNSIAIILRRRSRRNIQW